LHGHRLDAPNLEARLARMCQAKMYLHCEGALHWSTIRGLRPRGKELSERDPWWALERPFADFQDLSPSITDVA
jgi:hypothetical protein